MTYRLNPICSSGEFANKVPDLVRKLRRTLCLPGARVVLLAGCLLYPVACKSPAGTSSVNARAAEYLRLAVALGDRDPDSIDFHFGSDDPRIERELPKLADIAEQSAQLRDLLGQEEERPMPATDRRRTAFLRLQLDALSLRARMLSGAMLPFDSEAATFFGVTAGTDTAAAARAQTREKVARLLENRNHPAHAYSLYEQQFIVAPAKVPVVFEAALQECRTATLQHVQMPEGEHVDVEYVFHKPWSGFSRYLGHGHSLIQINVEFPLTVDRILNLACHEGYPGHHVFNTLRDKALVEEAHEEEWRAQPTFSRQSLVSEAAASDAPEMAFTPQQRLHVERDVLFPLAGLDTGKAERYLQVEALVGSLDSAVPSIARDYFDGRLEFVRAADALERETLMEHAETLLLYLNEYRSYALTYTTGRSMVQQLVERDHPSQEVRWRRYVSLMTQPVYSLDSD